MVAGSNDGSIWVASFGAGLARTGTRCVPVVGVDIVSLDRETLASSVPVAFVHSYWGLGKAVQAPGGLLFLYGNGTELRDAASAAVLGGEATTLSLTLQVEVAPFGDGFVAAGNGVVSFLDRNGRRISSFDSGGGDATIVTSPRPMLIQSMQSPTGVPRLVLRHAAFGPRRRGL